MVCLPIDGLGIPTTGRLANAVDHRHPITQGHSSRVAAIADWIGRRANISGSDLEDLRTAAFLHDVGHMTLAADSDQFEASGHAEEGERIVREAQFSEMVAVAVRHHHERWDGTGKHDGLVAEKIPLASRILAVAEAYEALSAGRGCQRLAPPDALKAVTDRAGSEFAPDLVEALARSIRDGNLEPNLPSVALPATA